MKDVPSDFPQTPGMTDLAESPPRRMLIVDDEASIRLALHRFFARTGWQVDDAPDGETALAMVLDPASGHARRPYSLIISDLRMPGLSGIEFHDRLKGSHPELLPRTIFTTGDLVSEYASSFVRSTSCLVIQKPFDLSALGDSVQRLIGAT